MESSVSRKRVSGHVYGLDSLRAFAVIGVTLFHMFPYTIRGGYLGVQLFFVLSGYLLAKSCESRRQRGEWQVLPFYLKRIQRIYPGLIIVLFVTTGVYAFLEKQVLAGIRPELFSILFGYNNWWQIAQNADYFTKITNASPFTPMWYLAIDLQFALVWPLIVLVFSYLCRKKGRRAGIWFIVALTVLSAVLMPVLYRPGEDVTRIYYGTDTRAYGLLFGVLLGFMQSGNLIPLPPVRTARKIALPLFAAMLAVMCVAFVMMDGQNTFVYRGGMLLMTVMFGVMILMVTDNRIPIESWLRLKPLVWLGKHSLEIYLWQYPVIFLFSCKRWTDIPGAPVLEIVLILLLSAWLQWMTNVLIQLRIPSSLKRAGAPVRYGAYVAAGLTVFLVFSGIVSAATAPAVKFAQKDELAKTLEENQRMLQESQSGAEKAGSDTGNAADVVGAGDVQLASIFEPDTAEVAVTQIPGASVIQFGENPVPQTAPVSAAALDLKYADPDITNSAKVSTEGVLLIGDSIMLDASPAIKEQLPDSYIDAMQNRQVYTCVDLAQELIDEGCLNQTVVISLGTNGEIEKSTARQIIEEFGPDISIFWVNLFGRTVLWDKEANALLLELSEEYPNFSVIDWASLIKDHPEWLWEDEEHPNIEGSEVYATLIRESLEAAAANQAAAV